LRTVFMGSPRFAAPSLEGLVLEGYDVVAVYTQPDRPAGRGRAPLAPPVKEIALRLGIPVVQPESLRSPEAVARLAEFRPELIVVCAYGQILPEAVVGMPPYRGVNVHFSLLPRHRGAAPVAAAILAGDDFTGVSIMLVEKRLDAGPLLAAAAIPIFDRDNTGTLTEKLSLVGAGLLIEALSGWTRGETTPRPQDEAAATYYPEVKKDAGRIDWRRPAVEVWRLVRAFNPWPGGYTTWRGRQLKILEATVLPGRVEIGRVIALPGEANGLGIGTGEGILGVSRLQLEGRKAMTAAEFLRGQRDFVGSVLPFS
jgi:methionyl-tRNA formyltransferase